MYRSYRRTRDRNDGRPEGQRFENFEYKPGDRTVVETSEGLDVRFKLRLLADLLKCPICLGFFREAVTIRECLHTFCKSCIFMRLYANRWPSMNSNTANANLVTAAAVPIVDVPSSLASSHCSRSHTPNNCRSSSVQFSSSSDLSLPFCSSSTSSSSVSSSYSSTAFPESFASSFSSITSTTYVQNNKENDDNGESITDASTASGANALPNALGEVAGTVLMTSNNNSKHNLKKAGDYDKSSSTLYTAPASSVEVVTRKRPRGSAHNFDPHHNSYSTAEDRNHTSSNSSMNNNNNSIGVIMDDAVCAAVSCFPVGNSTGNLAVCPKCFEPIGTNIEDAIGFDRSIQNLVDKLFCGFTQQEDAERLALLQFCDLLPPTTANATSAAAVDGDACAIFASATPHPAGGISDMVDGDGNGDVSQDTNIHTSDKFITSATMGIVETANALANIPCAEALGMPRTTFSSQMKGLSSELTLTGSRCATHSLSTLAFSSPTAKVTKFADDATILSSTPRCNRIYSSYSNGASSSYNSDIAPGEYERLGGWEATAEFMRLVSTDSSNTCPGVEANQDLAFALFPADDNIHKASCQFRLDKKYFRCSSKMPVLHIVHYLCKRLCIRFPLQVELLLEGLIVPKSHTLEFVCRSKKLNPSKCILFQYRILNYFTHSRLSDIQMLIPCSSVNSSSNMSIHTSNATAAIPDITAGPATSINTTPSAKNITTTANNTTATANNTTTTTAFNFATITSNASSTDNTRTTIPGVNATKVNSFNPYHPITATTNQSNKLPFIYASNSDYSKSFSLLPISTQSC